MGIFNKIREYAWGRPETEQEIENALPNSYSADGKSSSFADGIGEEAGWYTLEDLAYRLGASKSITPEGAFSKIGTVYACIDRRATALSKLPFQVFIRDGDQRARATEHRMHYLLTVRPNKYQSPTAYKKFIMVQMLTRGFACIYKKYNAWGEIEELIPWKSYEVGVHKLIGRDEYVYTHDGETYTEDEVIYIPYLSADGKRGKSPLSVARESCEAVQSMTRHLSNFYKKGAVKKGALKLTQPISDENKRKLKKQWADLYGGSDNSGDIAILDDGMEWADISLPLSDAQFVESRRLTALDIATIFNVPGSSVGLSQEKYSNLQEINDRFIQDVVAPDCINIEEAHNFSCFLDTENNYYAKFNISAGMRGSPEKRVAYYEKMLQIGVMTINEVRALEEMNGIGDLGDKHYTSLNYTTLETLEKHKRIEQ